MIPFILSQVVESVWCIFEDVVFFVDLTVLDFCNLLADDSHRVDKAVDLEFIFRLSRLDHETSHYRPAHSRCMETEVHQALCHILFCYACRLLEASAVEDELVGDAAFVTPECDFVILFQFLRDVVGVEDRNFS